MMTEDIYFVADPPTAGYIVTMVCIAVAGTIGLPFMIWLVYTAIYTHNWALVIAALFAGLICAGMLQSWKSVRSSIRQRREANRHSITISGQKFIYRKDDLVHEIQLADISNVLDRLEPSGGNQVWSVKITYRKADGSSSELSINAVEFSKAWENQGKFGVLLWEAIRANQG
jgi:hypothetical protein